MNRARAIDLLLRAGVRLGRDHRGRLITTPVPPELQTVADHLAATWGQPTEPPDRGGHPWRRCNACGQEPDGDRCDTPACKGRTLTYADRAPLLLDGQPIPCSRPGCRRPACTTTHWHEPLCQTDFHHLALALGAR